MAEKEEKSGTNWGASCDKAGCAIEKPADNKVAPDMMEHVSLLHSLQDVES